MSVISDLKNQIEDLEKKIDPIKADQSRGDFITMLMMGRITAIEEHLRKPWWRRLRGF